jgi:DNA modification methylase
VTSRRRRSAPASTQPSEPELELRWRGKYDADGRRVRVTPRDVDLVLHELHGPDRAEPGPRSMLVWGDNLDALDAWRRTHLSAVDLAYIDPPFLTGTTFDVATRLVDRDGEAHVVTQPAYSDRWSGGASSYLAMLAPRLERIHELLAPHGSLYIHVDPTVSHAVRLVADEIFGDGGFQREIVWRIGWVSGFKTRARNWIRNHDTILFYAKDPRRMRFNKLYVAHPEGYARRAGAQAKAPGMAIDDVWNAGAADLALAGAESLDSIQIKSFSREKTGYATQKNQSLLRRVIGASSNRGDVVLDAFAGAGTTAVVAAQMGRRFLACDMGEAAVQLARARLLADAPAASWSLASSVVVPPRAAAVEARGAGAWHIVAPLGDGDDAASDHATIDARIDRDGMRLEVGDIALASATTSLRRALAAGASPLLEIAIDWSADDGPIRIRQRATLDVHGELSRTFACAGAPAHVAIVLVDAMHRRRRIDLVVARRRTPTLHATVR